MYNDLGCVESGNNNNGNNNNNNNNNNSNNNSNNINGNNSCHAWQFRSPFIYSIKK